MDTEHPRTEGITFLLAMMSVIIGLFGIYLFVRKRKSITIEPTKESTSTAEAQQRNDDPVTPEAVLKCPVNPHKNVNDLPSGTLTNTPVIFDPSTTAPTCDDTNHVDESNHYKVEGKSYLNWLHFMDDDHTLYLLINRNSRYISSEQTQNEM